MQASHVLPLQQYFCTTEGLSRGIYCGLTGSVHLSDLACTPYDLAACALSRGTVASTP